MAMVSRPEDDISPATRDYRRALFMLKNLPDHCARDVGALADRIGADKLDLIQWIRADVTFARLIHSKVTK